VRDRAARTAAVAGVVTGRTVALDHLLLALAALLPQLLTRPGVATADTKTYLYLDPGRYLGQSLSMWDPTVGLGTVTHQQIGYVFPMGPFFWASAALGVPTWAAQRLWVGLVLLGAGTGAWWLARRLGVGAPGRLPAALAYMLSPYALQYIGHISVILLAFAALPWLVLLVDQAAGGGGWRPVAVVALVVAAMGSVNASSAFYVALGPLLWLLWSGWSGRHPWREVWRAAWRCALACAVVCAWWVAGLAVEAGYGLDVLRYTETVQAVSTSSLASEVVRGFGYWYFYGGDNFGPWVSAMPQFTQEPWLLGVGYVTATAAVAAAVVTRWRHRGALVAMTVLGMGLAVGAHPYASPTPWARLMRALLSSGSVGLALRSTDRATPLVLLGLSLLLGAGLCAAGRRSLGPAAAALCVGAVVAANPALWNGTSVPSTFTEKPPTPYERQAAAFLNGAGAPQRATPTGAVWGVPGQPFASTFSSTTVDPIWPALLRRPFVTREQQVMGSLATEDLLYGADDPIQDGVEDPAALAPLARLMGVGDLLVQNDLAFTRYDQPDPAVLWSALFTRPAGLRTPVGFGPTRPSLNRSTVVDEQTYTLPTDLPPMPELAVVPVARPRPLVRAEPAASSLVVDGDGVGLEDLAGTGLLDGDPSVLYAGTLDTNRRARRAALRPGATLVVTDTNRRQAFRWDNLTDVAGATLAAGQRYPADPEDEPLDIFPGAPADAQTTTALTGVASVSASAYGNPFQYLPEDRPSQAIDGDPDTAWQVGPFMDPRGQWWQVRFLAPRRADELRIVQPQNGPHNQWITAVTVRFDGRSPLRVHLGPASRRVSGQLVRFPARRFRTLRITIDATNLPPARTLAGGVSAVGLAEVELSGVQAHEHVVMPQDLLRAAGKASVADRLVVVMTRLRVAPATSRTDPEAALSRTLWLPSARRFSLTGTARIDADAPDQLVDELTGRVPAGAHAVVTASSTGRLQGEVADTASAALDGDPATAWSSPLGAGEQIGQAITVHLPSAQVVDRLHLQVVVDGRHSVPSLLHVSGTRGSATVRVPKLRRQDRPGGVDPVTVTFAPVEGPTLRVEVAGIRPLRAVDYYAGGDVTLPVAIAELGIPGVRMPPVPAQIPSPCRRDLLRIDGRPVPLRVSGTSAAALDGSGLALSPCGADAGGLVLGPGTHDIEATPGRLTGIDLDQLVLDSAPGGGPEPGDGPAGLSPPSVPSAPTVRVLRRRSTAVQLEVIAPGRPGSAGGGAGTPFWLVLGESLNRGWQASVDGRGSLGPPTLVDGFADGWLVDGAATGGRRSFEVTLTWSPQAPVDVALAVSAVAGALCAVVALWPRRRRRRARRVPYDAPGAAPEAPALVAPAWAQGARPRPSTPGGRPPWGRVALAAGGTGALAAAVIGPAAGVGLALVVAGAASARRGRLVLAAGAVAAVVAAALTMVVVEAVGRYPGDGQWPSHFETAGVLIWLALVLAVAETAVRVARGEPAGNGGARPGAP
jgi:arabinofuranan 3-O-arabinosyltransferase